MATQDSSSIIGGMFGLELMINPDGGIPPFVKDRSIFLVNASSAIWLLVRQLSPSHVWIPSYLCHAILESIRRSDRKPNFYEVGEDLAIPSFDWLLKVEKGDLVLLIDYFGFPCDPEFILAVKERGAWVLEDASQALLTEEVGRFSDFVIYSLRKHLGIPDGGILNSNCSIDLNSIELSPPPTGWWLKAFTASVLRREFDQFGGSRQWFELFQMSEAEAPIGAYRMSELSQTILLNGLDFTWMAERRIDNYRSLSSLEKVALIQDLPPGVVPLGFPIRLRNRDRLRQILFANEIYPPIHWQIQGFVPKSFMGSHRLSSEILTLPCDQRYDSSDMERMSQIILEVIGN